MNQEQHSNNKEIELAEDLKFTLDQLHDINSLAELDTADTTSQIIPSRAHRHNTTQLTIEERTPAYKTKIVTFYEQSCERAETLYCSILKGELTDADPIIDLVEDYIELMTTDMDITLNLLNYVHPPYKDHIYYHAIKKTIVALSIATAFNLPRLEIAEVGLAAFLADIGLSSINNSMRNKKRKFDRSDNSNIQKHPIFAANITRQLTGTYPSTNSAIFQAHERENGSGYPKAKSAKEIHLFAKIIAIADVYAALISPRPHRPALPPFNAVKNLINMSKLGLLNTQLLNAFLHYTPIFPIGSIVKLTNGMYAKVCSSNPKSVSSPIMRSISNTIGKALVERGFQTIDMSKTPGIRIVHAVDRGEFDSKLMDGF